MNEPLMRLLEPEQLIFQLTPGGFLSLALGDETYPRVHLYRTLPLTNERIYISVRDKEGKEIGFIKDLDDLPHSTQALLQTELARRYFVPMITRIYSLKEEFGYTYWETDTDAGPKRFTTKSGQGQVIQLGDVRILIIDLDGNRFEIPNYKGLDKKHAQTLETLL